MMKIQIREDIKEIHDPKTKEVTKRFENRVITHPNHKGKLINHTEDELKEMRDNILEVFEEIKKYDEEKK